MKHFLIALFVLFAFPAFAQDAKSLSQTPDVPVVSFSQQVEIVYLAKKDPRVLDIKFNQEKDTITLNLIVDKNVTLEQAKKMVLSLVIIAKSKSLDDPPKDKEKPGKGLYNYTINLAFPNGINLVNATKEKAKEDLHFEDPFQVEPLLRAGAGGL